MPLAGHSPGARRREQDAAGALRHSGTVKWQIRVYLR